MGNVSAHRWLNQAKTLYQDQTNKPFGFERAWMELRDAPKWKTTIDKSLTPVLNTPANVSPVPNDSTHPTPPDGSTPQGEDNPLSTPAPSSSSQRPGGVKAAKRALNHLDLMKKKMKIMEASTSSTQDMSRKRYAEMTQANNLQEKLVDMDILSKDLSTCIDDYE